MSLCADRRTGSYAYQWDQKFFGSGEASSPSFPDARTMEPRRYRIVVRGQLSERFADAFNGMVVQPGVRVTTFEGELTDQSMLHGLLGHIGSLGLELASVAELGDDNDD